MTLVSIPATAGLREVKSGTHAPWGNLYTQTDPRAAESQAGTRRWARGCRLVRLTDRAPPKHHKRRPPSTDPPLSCCEPPSAHPFPPEWRMRARRRSVSLHFVLISFRVPLGFPARGGGGGRGGGGCCWELGGKRRAVLCAVPLRAERCTCGVTRPTLQAVSPLPCSPPFSSELGALKFFGCVSHWFPGWEISGAWARPLAWGGWGGWGACSPSCPRGWHVAEARLCKFVMNPWRNDWNLNGRWEGKVV